MKKYWIKKGLMFFAFFVLAVLGFGLIVMLLWNNILPDVLGVKAITFVQALGILLLSKILFGGFKGRGGGRHGGGKWMDMKQKFSGMSVEDREKFKSEWKTRCGGRWKVQPEASEKETATQ